MKLRQLMEMPIGNITATDLQKGKGDSSFPKPQDWAMVSRANPQKRISNLFKNSPWTIDLHAYRLPVDSGNKSMGDYGIFPGIEPADRVHTFNDILGGDDIVPPAREGVITVLMFNHQENVDSLTPWMVAHRIAHGVEGYWITLDDFEEITGMDWDLSIGMFQMKSAKTEMVRQRAEEILNEIMAEYLITGDIRVWPVATVSGVSDDVAVDPVVGWEFENDHDVTYWVFDPEEAEEIKAHLLKALKTTVSYAVGKYWVAD